MCIWRALALLCPSETLCTAAKHGDLECIAQMLAAGADVNVHDGTANATPLQWAAGYRQTAAAKALLKAGARVDATNSSGETALMHAASLNAHGTIKVLLKAGADVNRASKDGATALHHACSRWHLHAARVLLGAGARTDVRNCKGQRPIDVVRAVVGCVASSWSGSKSCNACAWCAGERGHKSGCKRR